MATKSLTKSAGFIDGRAEGSSPGKFLRVAVRALSGLALFIILACGGEGPTSCKQEQSLSPANGPVGLTLESEAGLWQESNFTHGETFTVPVAVRLLPGETPGDTVVVTPALPSGITVTPATRSVPLPQANQKAFVTFTATVTSTARFEDRTLVSASRTEKSGGVSTAPNSVYASGTLNIVEDLVAVTVTPPSVILDSHGQQTFTLSILPRGDADGTVQIFPEMEQDRAEYQIIPGRLDVPIVRGSTTPVVRTVLVKHVGVNNSATLKIKLTPHATVATARITIRGAVGGPSFLFNAEPLTITTENMVDSEEFVTFTLTPVNGFTGDVTIHHQTEFGLFPVPGNNDFTVNIPNGTPVTFTRRFNRYATITTPMQMTWTAKSTPLSITEQLIVTVNHP